MFTSINRTIFDIPLTWDRTRFESSRVKCRQARKLIEASVNAQYNKQLKDLFFQKLDVENTIVESQQRLLNQEKKMRALENLTEVASQSLDDYFDKRMEHVRTAIQEHCDAIRQILREENDHWQEIHTAIDQNLITKEDLHPPKAVEEEAPLANIHTIDEVDEEEQTSKLLNNKTVTPLLTQMIRKSRMLSIRPSANVSTEGLLRSKEEQMSVMLPLTSARRTLTVVDTTFVVKHEQSQTSEPDESYQAEVEIQPAEPSPATNIIPIQSAPMTTVTPLEPVPTPEAETTSSYSQPKPPARLYFSPTLLLDDDDTGPIQPVLSAVDQNKTNNGKPKAAIRRCFGQTFLLDNVKTEEVDESQDAENIRPKISDEIPFLFQADPTMLMDKPSMIEPNSELIEIVELQKSIVYTKRRTNALVEPKVEPEPIHMTRRATRQRKPVVEPETVARPTRKRKQSVSDHDDGREDNVALRKKKPGRQPAKSTTRKPRAKKAKEVPIRELSPLPIVDRSKHYSTRFSTRSHRFNNLTLSTTAATLHDDDADEDYSSNKTKRSLVKSRAKSTRRTRHHDNDQAALPAAGSTNKKQPKTRAKSAVTTRTRKK